jgi:hypothetical protein
MAAGLAWYPKATIAERADLGAQCFRGDPSACESQARIGVSQAVAKNRAFSIAQYAGLLFAVGTSIALGASRERRSVSAEAVNA